MPWPFRVLILFAFIFALALLGEAIRRRLAKRTLDAWGGEGVNPDLGPAEAAVLLGLHPGTVVAAGLLSALEEGRVELLSRSPVRLSFPAGRTGGEVEAALREAVDDEGAIAPDGAAEFLEAVWRRLDEQLAPYSGRETAVYYRELVKRLWDEVGKLGEVDSAAFPWLVLADANEVWELMGEGEAFGELKAAFRLEGRLRRELFSGLEFQRRVRAAKEGYFAYRQDLAPKGRHQEAPWWAFRKGAGI